jgi:acyl-CoA synthetase (AMP-forming)/AMP-acid ligase II
MSTKIARPICQVDVSLTLQSRLFSGMTMERVSRCFPEPTAECSTLVQLLRWRALHQPNHRAYTFLVKGETEETHLTFAELDQQARSIAASLQGMEVTGERALLLYPPGLEYIAAFFGCLYAGVIAVAAYPPDPVRLDQTLPRFLAVAVNAQPSVTLGTTTTLSMAEALFTQSPALQSMRWLATDDITSDSAREWQDPAVSSSSLAFLQYTSGSTATPNGVMLTHGNLLYNSALIHQRVEHTPDSRWVIWLPPYHDMGLVGGIIQPLYGGFWVVLMSPLDFVQRPFRWLKVITRYKATTSGGPNFAYDLCVRKITPDQRATLDLSSWQVAFNGAEPVRYDTLRRFAAAFEPCGFRWEAFYPCYGLAEATLFASGGVKAERPVIRAVQKMHLEDDRVVTAVPEDENGRTLVGCGETLPGQKIVIVDPETLVQCSQNQVGEIWISGPSVAQGYWNKPRKTERTFRAYLGDSGEGPFLRTGDLGFLQDGELFITGRLKDLIIVDGLNHYPQDIELAAETSHPALRRGCCGAFSIDVDNAEQLILVAEVRAEYSPDRRHRQTTASTDSTQCSSPNSTEITRAVRHAVTRFHGLRVHDVVLLKSGTIPKTSSGKIRRHACRDSYLAGTLTQWGANSGKPKL